MHTKGSDAGLVSAVDYYSPWVMPGVRHRKMTDAEYLEQFNAEYWQTLEPRWPSCVVTASA